MSTIYADWVDAMTVGSQHTNRLSGYEIMRAHIFTTYVKV